MTAWDSIKACFPPRLPDTHKGTYGTVLSVCGSYGMAGAAILAARAAYRSGTGLVVAALPSSIYPIAAVSIPEAIFAPFETNSVVDCFETLTPYLQKANAVLVGCGLGNTPFTAELVQTVLKNSAVPVVLDADGINAAIRHIDILETASALRVLTPHPKELAHLLDSTVEHIQADRKAAALIAAARFHATVVLKGHRTVIADETGALWINETGNPGMAVAGSGDILAGLIAGLLAQGLSPWDAARCGVYLHGAAGDRAAMRLSQHAMMPTDILEEIGPLFLQLEQ
mgnify:CR=1 FL=1